MNFCSHTYFNTIAKSGKLLSEKKGRGILLAFLLILLYDIAAAQTVQLDLRAAPLEQAISSIQKQTGFLFWYSKTLLKGATPVTIHAKNMGLRDALLLLFKEQPLKFEVVDKTIVLSRKLPELPGLPGIRVTGKVMDKKGDALPGVTVMNKGTAKGATTTAEGLYGIDVSADATLIFSFTGFERVEVGVNGRATVDIVMVEQPMRLDETVVIGYGTTTRRMNTGSVASVNAEEISKQPVTNVLSALQGRATGVFVTNTSGLPGAQVNIQVRGRNSISAGNAPLYVVDGVPFNATALNEITGNLRGAAGRLSPFSTINPGDIESIEVLKDADATAIYGSRAASGVVLITTKKGKAGKIKADINFSSGAGKAPITLDMMGTEDYLQMRREAYSNDGRTPTAANAPDLLLWDQQAYTDWQQLLMGGTAARTSAQASLSGGTEAMRFLISGNYHNEGTVYPGSQSYQRSGMHLNLQFGAKEARFKGALSVSYAEDNSRLLPSSVINLYRLPPNYPLYDSTGKFYWGGSRENPMALLQQRSIDKSKNLVSNLTLSYQLSDGLRLKANLGYTTTGLRQTLVFPKISLNPQVTQPAENFSRFGDNQVQGYLVEPQLEYTQNMQRGRLLLLGGATWQYNTNEGSYFQANNFSNEGLMESLGGASTITGYYSALTEYKYASVFARANYTHDGRYLFNATFRRDGSSKFGPNKRFGNFYAFGAGWIFSAEPFMKEQHLLSFGKLRASYGATGNDQVADYQYLSTYGTNSTLIYQNASGLQAQRIANPDYRWELTRKLEAAIELGFFKDRLMLQVAGYRNRSGNQLINFPLSIQTGFAGYQSNLPALVQNTGLEAEINAALIQKDDFAWNMSANLSVQRNKLLSFPGLQATTLANTYVVGRSLGIVKGYRFNGVDPGTGVATFYDQNKDGKITSPEDNVVMGDLLPRYFGGLNNHIRYKGFELDVHLQFARQKATNINTGLFYPPGYGANNFPVYALDRWKKPGDITSVSGATATAGTTRYSAFFPVYYLSDQSISDASYLRLKNIALSWNMPSSWTNRLKVDKVRLYVQGQNLWTLSDYLGFDPESQVLAYPPLKLIIAGIQLSL